MLALIFIVLLMFLLTFSNEKQIDAKHASFESRPYVSIQKSHAKLLEKLSDTI